MASIALPLISAALPLLKPVITSLVTHIESLFGSKTGNTKLQTVLNALKPVADALSSAGIIPGKIDASSLSTIIQTVVEELNSSGVLKGTSTTPTALPPNSAVVGVSTLSAGSQIRVVSGLLTITQ